MEVLACSQDPTTVSYLCVLPGLALTFILENSFKPESGSRPGVPKIGILITDGKSQDDVIPPAQSLREAGIELFAIGTPCQHKHEQSSCFLTASPWEHIHRDYTRLH